MKLLTLITILSIILTSCMINALNESEGLTVEQARYIDIY